MKQKSLFLFAIGLLTISLLVGCGAKTEVNSDNKNNQQQISTTDNKSNILKKVKELANEGKVEGSDPFAIGSKRTEIENAWGKSTPGKAETEAYPQKNIFMYYDESNQVDQLITTSPILTNITYDEVIKALGQPVDIRADEGIMNLFYNTEGGNKYDLTIQIIEDKISKITVGNKPTPNPDQIPQSQ